MNDFISLSVIKYRPPILTPSLPDLQRTCTRLTERLSAAAASLVDKYLSIVKSVHALDLAHYLYSKGLHVFGGISKSKFHKESIFGIALQAPGKYKTFTKSAHFKSSIFYHWVISNCFHVYLLLFVCSNYTQKRIFVKGGK